MGIFQGMTGAKSTDMNMSQGITGAKLTVWNYFRDDWSQAERYGNISGNAWNKVPRRPTASSQLPAQQGSYPGLPRLRLLLQVPIARPIDRDFYTFNVSFQFVSNLSVPFHTVSWFSVPFHTVSWFSVPFHTVSKFIVPFHTMSWFSVPFHTLSWFSVLSHAVSWFSVPFHTVS
jgi:hypothetical protein